MIDSDDRRRDGSDVGEAPPPARRTLRRPPWRDARMVGGLALVVGSSVIGAVVVGGADDTTPVWSVSNSLAAGSTLTEADLVVAEVQLDPSLVARYVDATEPAPIGATLTRSVSAAELLPAAAVAAEDREVRRLVSLPLDAGHAPVGLARGDRVDVYVTPKSEAGRAGTTARVLEAGVVDGIDGGERRFGGSGDGLTVVLAVPDRLVERVVAGTRRGDVDLVRVQGQVTD